MSALVFYTLFYLLISGCIIYPPSEFVSAGLTVKDIFANCLGSENEFFIQYHIRRSTITLLVHSLIPLGYVIGLIFFGHIDIERLLFAGENSIGCFIIIFVIIGPLYILNVIFEWFINNWNLHPIAQNLSAYCDNNESWRTIASAINTEYRRVDKIIIITNIVTRVVATDNWIIKITPYKLYIAHQSNTTLIVNKSDIHMMSPVTKNKVQYINIQVSPLRAMAQSFDIRFNALAFEDLQDKISRPIIISQDITFHKSLLDMFVETFKEEVNKNPFYETTEELVQCVGCMQVFSNIKLNKLCGNIMENNDCTMCYCRPMWCIECMAKWFASKQDDDAPETWLSSKCTCPVCRATFCILDVTFVDN